MKILIVCLFTLSSLTAYNQATGYLGKKTVVDFNLVGNYIILPNLIQKNNRFMPRYKVENGQLIEEPDHFDYGGELNISRVVSRRFALGICGGIDFFNVGLVRGSLSYSGEYFRGMHEKINVRGIYLLPTISFAHKVGSLPMGIVHELGIGYRSDKPIKKDYRYDYDQTSSYDSVAIDMNSMKLYNFEHKPVVGVPIFYSVKFRLPINDFLFFNAGLRYSLTFQNTDLEFTFPEETGYFHSENEMQRTINSRRRCSIIKGFFGLSFVFK